MCEALGSIPALQIKKKKKMKKAWYPSQEND
jgi:hypothetical protein